MVYWVKHLLEAGLLEQVGTRKEEGKVAAVYRTVADEFVITGPLAFAYATQPEGVMQLDQEVMNYLQTTLTLHYARQGDDLTLVTYALDDRYAITDITTRQALVQADGAAVQDSGLPVNDWFRLKLTRREAQQLTQEFRALVQRIKAQAKAVGDEEHPFYVGHLALAEDLD